MNNLQWIQILGPYLLMGVGGLITWIIKSYIEELRTAEANLTEARRKIYTEILKPYIIIFANLKNTQEQTKALEIITSEEYRKTAFDLCLFGSDEVVKSYNELMQHTYKAAKASGSQDTKELFKLWSCFLLAIRKSLGNKKTRLNNLDMMRGMITDIDSYFSKQSS